MITIDPACPSLVQPFSMSCSHGLIWPPQSRDSYEAGSRSTALGAGYSIHTHVPEARLGAHRMQTHVPLGCHFILCAVAISLSKRKYICVCMHTATCSHPHGTHCAQDQEEVEHCQQQQGSREPPLFLTVNPHSNFSLNPCLGNHDPEKRKKTCMTLVGTATHGLATPCNSESLCFKDGAHMTERSECQAIYSFFRH